MLLQKRCVHDDTFSLPPSLVVSAPNVLRVGTPFTMAAHAEGATQDVRVLLSIMSMTLGDLLDEKPIVLSKKNNYAGIVNMTVCSLNFCFFLFTKLYSYNCFKIQGWD